MHSDRYGAKQSILVNYEGARVFLVIPNLKAEELSKSTTGALSSICMAPDCSLLCPTIYCIRLDFPSCLVKTDHLFRLEAFRPHRYKRNMMSSIETSLLIIDCL